MGDGPSQVRDLNRGMVPKNIQLTGKNLRLAALKMRANTGLRFRKGAGNQWFPQDSYLRAINAWGHGLRTVDR